jgi:predicted ATPase
MASQQSGATARAVCRDAVAAECRTLSRARTNTATAEALEALVFQVVALSRRNPALMIFEDAHWTDPTSRELFCRIVDKIPILRVLLIVTCRPEFEPPWIGRPYVTDLTSIGWQTAKLVP